MGLSARLVHPGNTRCSVPVRTKSAGDSDVQSSQLSASTPSAEVPVTVRRLTTALPARIYVGRVVDAACHEIRDAVDERFSVRAYPSPARRRCDRSRSWFDPTSKRHRCPEVGASVAAALQMASPPAEAADAHDRLGLIRDENEIRIVHRQNPWSYSPMTMYPWSRRSSHR